MRTINVTANDIKRGQKFVRDLKGSGKSPCGGCAITLALRRTYKDPKAYWLISSGTLKADFVEPITSAQATKVDNFICGHDSLKKVKPFKFQVEVTKRQ